MRMIVSDSYETMSERAADRIVEAVRRKPDLLLCAASGSTPARTYELLAEKRRQQPDLFEHLRVLKLDEWGGLAIDDPATCEADLQQHLLGPLGVSAGRYTAFSSDPADPRAECERIRAELERHGPIDLCALGLGVNGHLGLNEPADTLNPFAHVAHLHDTSLRHPMLTRARGQVRYGLTLGMADILGAKNVLLLVSGQHKREPLGRLSSGQISTWFPASFLWLHPDVICSYDMDAAPELDLSANR